MSSSHVNCSECGVDFKKKTSELTESGNNFCSRSCSASFNNRLYPKVKCTKMCKNCGLKRYKDSAFCEKCRFEKYSKNICVDCNTICRGQRCIDCYKIYNKLKSESSIKTEPKIYKYYNKCNICEEQCHKRSINCKKCRIEKLNMIDYSLQDVIDTCIKTYGRINANVYNKIRDRAKTILKNDREKICQHCGYSKHVEACHKIAISSFPKETMVSVINDLNNLLYLCPNCHWEFDNNLIELH